MFLKKETTYVIFIICFSILFFYLTLDKSKSGVCGNSKVIVNVNEENSFVIENVLDIFERYGIIRITTKSGKEYYIKPNIQVIKECN